ncbi:pre-mrna-splicing factor cwf21 [Diplodia corticola]|uniref:Pre-mrna-splicing factor cwf21 n=1 Tax=Diplodia corticola TaxID=236234 RepID=A0A1J9SJK0_9PEZI|nr:pre-mrna-splicing factor cwf21 [Diplodia corticola]OJD40519.1 pre-mrna-splicing factor cwf21 [Diplodia corticola]
MGSSKQGGGQHVRLITIPPHIYFFTSALRAYISKNRSEQLRRPDMSGVGDIIAIAELGYKLAAALKRYIDEVEAAEDNIKALVIEVEQASSHVGGLSKLLDENQETAFLSPVGEKNCKRLAADFKATILTIRSALGAPSESETDLDKIVEGFLIKKRQKWQWPLLSKKLLAAPRERLGELKLELQLLMVSATAHKLSKMPSSVDIEKQRADARAKLRRLRHTKEKASSKYKKGQGKKNGRATRPRSPSPEIDLSSMSSSDGSYLSDDDEEELIREYLEARRQAEEQEFREYDNFLREKEREERRRTERGKQLIALAEQVERDAENERRKQEARREVERENEKERITETERQKKKAEYETRIREAIVGTGLEEEKVNEVMSKIEESAAFGEQLDPLTFIDTPAAASQDQTAGSTTSETQTVSTSRRSRPRKRLFGRWGSATASFVSDSSSTEAQSTQQPILEAWSLKTPRSRMPLPVTTLLAIVKKQNYKSVLKSFASLPQAAKDEFHALMECKDAEPQPFAWQLVGIQITRHRIRVGLLTYAEEAMSVIAILQRQDDYPPQEPTRPKLPQRSGSNRPWPSSATNTIPTSILKKNPDSLPSSKPLEAVATPEHRVRISPEAPGIYTDHIGSQDTSTDANSVDTESQAHTMTSSAPRPSTGRPSGHAPVAFPQLLSDARTYSDIDSKPDFFDDEQSIYSRHRSRSRSRDPRETPRQSRSPQLTDGLYTRRDRSPYGSLPIRSSSRDTYAQSLPASRDYLRSRSRSRPRSTQYDPLIPSIAERLDSIHDDWFPHDFDPTESNGYVSPAPPRRPFIRRSNTNDSYDDRSRYHSERRQSPRRAFERGKRQTSPRGRSGAYDDDYYYNEYFSPRTASPLSRMTGHGHLLATSDRAPPLRRRSPPPPPPPPQRSDSGYYNARISDFYDSPPTRHGPQRRRSNSWDIMFPSLRVFYGDWPGADSRSPPSRRSTLSPDRTSRALVLHGQQLNSEDLERLKKKAKKRTAAAAAAAAAAARRRRRRSSTRRGNRSEEEEDLEDEEAEDRESGDGSETDRGYEGGRYARKGRKATVADPEDGEESGSEVPERFQDFFNPDYKPPAAEAVVNGTSEKHVENSDRNERIDSSVLSITEEALNGVFTSEPQSMDSFKEQA